MVRQSSWLLHLAYNRINSWQVTVSLGLLTAAEIGNSFLPICKATGSLRAYSGSSDVNGDSSLYPRQSITHSDIQHVAVWFAVPHMVSAWQ